ncbi:fumarylacetoacetate hydrolase family protein [Ideonella sp.]|uniref:fumarylacetoacetate hydrolase family protein n=1 Tax=Ideonella sp. TaxID=1929293 RepID=UPI002B477E0A|nr:fumarylacetoacetate hydrolase family protein [Ideonella sp.]
MNTFLPGLSSVPMSPWRLSGVVYGTLMNDLDALAALGEALHQPPYKAPPKAPVLGLKPRNTLAASGAEVVVPAGFEGFEVGAALGLVIGRTACHVARHQALAHLAGYIVVADLSLPCESHYRPALRFRARDGSCLVGPEVVARDAVSDPDALDITVSVDGRVAQRASTSRMQRGAARLLADVSEFMTLRPGDILLLGVPAGAPLAGPGQHIAVEIAGVGRVDASLVQAPGAPS